MSVVTVVFDSEYGQTRKIAERVAEVTEGRGHAVRFGSVKEITPADLDRSQAVVLLAPVYDRKHAPGAVDFALANRERLAPRPLAIFSVSLAAAVPGQRFSRNGAETFVQELLDDTGLRPITVAYVAGALNYPDYPPPLRIVFRMAARLFGFPTATSRSHELTDWSEVETAAHEFLDRVEDRPPGDAPPP